MPSKLEVDGGKYNTLFDSTGYSHIKYRTEWNFIIPSELQRFFRWWYKTIPNHIIVRALRLANIIDDILSYKALLYTIFIPLHNKPGLQYKLAGILIRLIIIIPGTILFLTLTILTLLVLILWLLLPTLVISSLMLIQLL